jgi:hypothetical protein
MRFSGYQLMRRWCIDVLGGVYSRAGLDQLLKRVFAPVETSLYIIHDNDFSRDADGYLAYLWLHHAQDLGLCKILACISGEDDHLLEVAGAFANTSAAKLDYIRRWFKHPDVPIGLPYADAPNTWKTLKEDTDLSTSVSAPYAQSDDSTDVYGTVLAGMPDNSVTILTTGQFVALARFMQSTDTWNGKTSMELLASKVCMLACGAGQYPAGVADINQTNFGCPWSVDAPTRAAIKTATVYVLNNWPVNVPITFYGEDINTGELAFDPDILLGSHPAKLRPYSYNSTTKVIEAHDSVRAMLLVLGLGGMHTLSASGYVTVGGADPENPDDTQTWTADAEDGTPTEGKPLCRYVSVADDEALERIWASYLLKRYPSPPSTGLTAGYDFGEGDYGDELPATANAILDLSGNNFHMTAFGTTKPQYLRNGIITFPTGSYLQRTIGDTAGYGDLSIANRQWFGVMDVYIADPTVTDELTFAGATFASDNNTENWSIAIANKKWRFRRRSSDGVTVATLTSTDDITLGWHRIAWANRQITFGATPTWQLVLYVDGIEAASTTANISQHSMRGYLRINGGSWTGAVAADYPIAMFRLHLRQPISASELASNWMETAPKVQPTNVRRNVDRGDGIEGTFPFAPPTGELVQW